MTKALILGGGGFAGRYLAAYLRSAGGWQVAVTGRSKAPEDVDCDESFALNILDGAETERRILSYAPDCIFHLAAQSSAAKSWREPGATVDANIRGTVNVLEAARKAAKPPRVLLVGSSEEYGTVRAEECPITEAQPLHPGNPYALSKASQEMLGRLYGEAYGLEVISVRAFNHIGPGQSPDFAVSDFCRQTALLEKYGGEGVIRVGNLSARRDFTDVRDVVRAYALLMEKGESGQVYNVGSGCAVSVGELLERILALSGREIRTEIDEARFRPVDAPLNVADISRLREATGWRPEITAEETLRDTLNYWRDRV